MLLAFLGLMSLPAPLMAENRHALVIGNSAYQNITVLDNTIADAEAYAETFAELGYQVTSLKDLDRNGMEFALADFLEQIQPGDTAVFVYSGHGWSDGKTNFLLPTDVTLQSTEGRMRSMSIPLQNGVNGIVDQIRQAGAAVQVAIIDACRNNIFGKSGTRSAGMTRGLSIEVAPQGAFLIFSAGAGEQALDGLRTDDSSQTLSVFTRYFLPRLKAGMYLEDAINDTQLETARAALGDRNHKQNPAYYDQINGKFCLSGSCIGNVSLAPPTSCSDVRAVWADVKDAQDASVLAAFKKRYAACDIYANLAQSRIDLLAPPQPISAPPLEDLQTRMSRSAAVRQCDRLGLFPGHPDIAAGLAFGTGPDWADLNGAAAESACGAALKEYPDHPRLSASLGRAYDKQEQYEAAHAAYLIAANQGDLASYNNLGILYEDGEGVSQDYALAMQWYRKAAEQGYAYAQNRLGYMYQNGLGVPESDREAATWFRKAAEQGHAEAQYGLGQMYQKGRGVPESDREAATWYRKAAEQGHTMAQNSLGYMYFMGLGVPQSYMEAAAWYRKAAEQGIADAQYNLGQMYRLGRGVPQSDREAATWYRKAAEQGDAEAQYILGELYDNGRGVPQSDIEAVAWYRKAAEQGHVVAQNNLGYMYRKGRGVPQSDREAVAWYRKAAEQGHADAQTNLGYMYFMGLGVPQSDIEAVAWFRKAAEQENAIGQSNLGEMYRDGRGVPQSDIEAVAWFRKAAEQGNATAQSNLDNM
ncbi:caspase family protein [Parasedimentitalea psychrophila]|nr:caspase family protein [Parasedimentitalea psychrophila]